MSEELSVAPEEAAEFAAVLETARNVEAETPAEARLVDGKHVIWSPLPGSQVDFLTCPLFEVLYHGTRGNGKTLCLLMAFAQHVGQGHGAAWRGIIFRETYPQLGDIVAKTEKWFRQIFPTARFNKSKMVWEFATGEKLFLRHMRNPEDYWKYHGHEYPFIGWEELTNWTTDDCYRTMFSCCRSASPKVPRMIRATTNPYGVGRNWIAERFRLLGQWWNTIIIDDALDVRGKPEPTRVAIHGHIDENTILLEADPFYKMTISASARNSAMGEAWSDGSWDLIAGGMFDDVWDRAINSVPDFRVPESWRIDRAFDWGSSKPFSVGWYATSDGSDIEFENSETRSTVRGDVFRVREWYGFTGRANEGIRMLASDIAQGIVEREVLWGWRTTRGTRVSTGVADAAIFNVENGNCIASDMDKPVRLQGRVYQGVQWLPADKRPGSRKQGWEAIRKLIRAAHPLKTKPREKPGFFVIGQRCPQFLRTVLTLPRDPKDMDDIDTNSEDHCGDELRYRLRAAGTEAKIGRTVGLTH